MNKHAHTNKQAGTQTNKLKKKPGGLQAIHKNNTKMFDKTNRKPNATTNTRTHTSTNKENEHKNKYENIIFSYLLVRVTLEIISFVLPRGVKEESSNT